MRGTMVALAACLMLEGCVATTPRIDPSRIEEVRSGFTTYTEVVKRFGRPSLMSKNPDGTRFATYVHADPKDETGSVVPLVAGVQRDSVTFHFDARDALVDVTTTTRGSGERPPLRSTVNDMPSTPASKRGGAVSAEPSTGNPGSASRGWLWRLPDWLPGTPRENR